MSDGCEVVEWWEWE